LEPSDAAQPVAWTLLARERLAAEPGERMAQEDAEVTPSAGLNLVLSMLLRPKAEQLSGVSGRVRNVLLSLPLPSFQGPDSSQLCHATPSTWRDSLLNACQSLKHKSVTHEDCASVFSGAFLPDVVAADVWKHVAMHTPSSAGNTLKRLKLVKQDKVDFAGTSLPRRTVIILSPIASAAFMFLLLVHLFHARQLASEHRQEIREFPWPGLRSGKLPAVFKLTLPVIPAGLLCCAVCYWRDEAIELQPTSWEEGAYVFGMVAAAFAFALGAWCTVVLFQLGRVMVRASSGSAGAKGAPPLEQPGGSEAIPAGAPASRGGASGADDDAREG
jgi:hypothetical protein